MEINHLGDVVLMLLGATVLIGWLSYMLWRIERRLK